MFWRSLVACWLSVALLRDYVCLWSVYHCSWAWGQIPDQQYVAWAHAQAMCLRCVCVALEALLAWRGVAWRSSSVAFLLILCKTFFPSKWFSLQSFLVVPPAGEFFVFLCNAASITLDQQQLIGALSYPSPVTSTASSSWSPQLADSLTEAILRAIRNSIPDRFTDPEQRPFARFFFGSGRFF